MGISLKTQKMLWGRAASRCAFPDCRKELVFDSTQTDDESIVGEACHIVAKSADGPRGESPLTSEQRDKYNNLLLLCNIHHKVIDDQYLHYTIDLLHEIKKSHEVWVSSQLQGFDAHKQRDDEIYASYLEEFEQQIDIENWNAWTSWLFGGGQPQLSKEMRSKLEGLRSWLFSRVWPNRYQNLEIAFENFRRVLQDLLNTFDKHSVECGPHDLVTEKFYKIDRWDPDAYDRLAKDYDYHCYLVEDLALELNRAVNYIFDSVRQSIQYGYRLDVGVLYVTSGPHMDLTFKHYRAQYLPEQKQNIPYPGLKAFAETVRFERDFWFGDKT